MPKPHRKKGAAGGDFDALVPEDIGTISAAIATHSVLPVNKDTIMSFPQGWDHLLKALERPPTIDVLTADERREAVAIFEGHGLRHAFTFRRELINYKKLMLHVSQRATDSERKLKRLATFFYLNGREGLGTPQERARHNALQRALNQCGGLTKACNDARMLTKAICTLHRLPNELASGATTGRSWKLAALPGSLLTAKSATPVAKLVDWGIRLGLLVKTALLEGVLHDWREESSDSSSSTVVAVGNVPGKSSVSASGGAIPVDIKETNSGGSNQRKDDTNAEVELLNDCSSSRGSSSNDHSNADSSVLVGDGSSGLVFGHRTVVAALEHWSEPQRTHLLALFVAHGGPKAFALEQELRRYAAALEKVNADLQTGLFALTDILEQCRNHDQAVSSNSTSRSKLEAVETDSSSTSDVSKDIDEINIDGIESEVVAENAANRGEKKEQQEQEQQQQDPANAWPALDTMARKHETALTATKHGNVAVLQCLRAILDNGSKDARLFMAGDDVGMTDVAPASFGANLPQLLAALEAVAADHQPALDRAIAALDHGAAPPSLGWSGSTVCSTCQSSFHHLWVLQTVCYRCERRARADGTCPYSQHRKCSARSWCPHAQKCAACERHSCSACRLHAGDGDAVASLVQQLQPSAIYLDWDRTCCSTKSGASPLRGNHSVDETLLDLMRASSNEPGGTLVEVVTRNSHGDDIKTFLFEKYGVHNILVHVVKQHAKADDEAGPRSKAEIVCREQVDGGNVLFVDDDIDELVQGDIAAAENVHRIHFTRGS